MGISRLFRGLLWIDRDVRELLPTVRELLTPNSHSEVELRETVKLKLIRIMIATERQDFTSAIDYAADEIY